MKKIKIDSCLKNKEVFKNISITDDAIKQILFLINLNSDNKGIRLSIKKSGCAGFRYTMKLVKNSELKEKDTTQKIFFYKNIYIYISSQEMPFLEGLRIDFIKDNINKIFKFYNPKLEKFCGCGESFSIN